MALGLRRRNVRARHRRGLYLRGAQARLPYGAGIQEQRRRGLSVTRGEMDALYVPESSANNFVKAKQNWALATISRTKSRYFPDRPTIFEAAKMDPGRDLGDGFPHQYRKTWPRVPVRLPEFRRRGLPICKKP